MFPNPADALVASCQYRTDVSASLGGAELQVA
jgi:hypothetical protein